jgi:hypothetical protein
MDYDTWPDIITSYGVQAVVVKMKNLDVEVAIVCTMMVDEALYEDRDVVLAGLDLDFEEINGWDVWVQDL